MEAQRNRPQGAPLDAIAPLKFKQYADLILRLQAEESVFAVARSPDDSGKVPINLDWRIAGVDDANGIVTVKRSQDELEKDPSFRDFADWQIKWRENLQERAAAIKPLYAGVQFGMAISDGAGGTLYEGGWKATNYNVFTGTISLLNQGSSLPKKTAYVKVQEFADMQAGYMASAGLSAESGDGMGITKGVAAISDLHSEAKGMGEAIVALCVERKREINDADGLGKATWNAAEAAAKLPSAKPAPAQSKDAEDAIAEAMKATQKKDAAGDKAKPWYRRKLF
jgi:hypothetical protein